MRSRVALFKAEQQRQAAQQRQADQQQPGATSDEDDDFPEVSSRGFRVYRTEAEHSCLSSRCGTSSCSQLCKCSQLCSGVGGNRSLALVSV